MREIFWIQRVASVDELIFIKWKIRCENLMKYTARVEKARKISIKNNTKLKHVFQLVAK